MKKRKRYLNETEKKRLKIILYFFLVISFLSFLSLIIITILSKKSVINEEAEIFASIISSTILAICSTLSAKIGKRIEDNRYYERIVEYLALEEQNNLKELYEAYMNDIIDAELRKYRLKLHYNTLLFYNPEFNFYTYNYINKDTQFIVKFLEAEIMYFVGDSKILDLDIGDERLIRLEYKEFESISEIVEYVNELYNFCKIQV